MEKKIGIIPGFIMVIVQILILVYAAHDVYAGWQDIDKVSSWLLPGILMVIFFFIFNGYLILSPNMAAVISFMGKYKGTIKDNGFLFKNPLYGAKTWSLKVSNYATEILEVNDSNGVPIEIAAIIVWKVGDVYKAEYEVEDLNEYIDNQFEISLRQLAKQHTYGELAGEDKDFIESLTNTSSKAGVEILDAKITHLNYAKEIASAMLQKQQAGAMSEAKGIIVQNAVAIAEDAAANITDIDARQRATFISNLIIVLCSDRAVTPTISVNNQQNSN